MFELKYDKLFRDGYLRAAALLCIISLLLNMYGIWWGLPEQWEPDEDVRAALAMANAKDPNPHNFVAPTLHKYMILTSLAPYYAYLTVTGKIKDVKDNAHMDSVPDYFLTDVWMISRALSALLGALTVLLFYLTGRNIKNPAAGLISASFAAFTMGFANISHYATVDTTVIFWTALSLYFASLMISRGEKKHYLLAGAAAGLALSTKYTAGLLFIPLIAAHLLSFGRKGLVDGKLILAVAMVPLFFAIGSPYALLDYNALLSAVSTHQSETLSDYKGISNPNSGYVSTLFNLINAFGLPLFVFVMCSAAYSFYAVCKKKEGYRYDLFLFAWIVPFFLVVGSWNFSPMRYIMPGALFLALPAGVFSARMLGSNKAFKWVVLLVIVYSLAYSIAADLLYVGDSRYHATSWLEENALPGKTVEIYSKRYNPAIPDGLVLSQPPVAGFENESSAALFDQFLYGLEARKPDYIVLSSLYYERYFVDPEAYMSRTQYFGGLIGGKAGYGIAARFGPPLDGNEGAVGFGSRQPFGDRIVRSMILSPSPEFVNPTVLILWREA